MWIDDIKRKDKDFSACCGKISIGGVSPAVETDAELRDLRIVRCGGALRIPKANEEQIVLPCDNGDFVILGRAEGDVPDGMEAGEIYIETDNAAVLIKNNGKIKITGELEIQGSLSVNGRSVNGA